MALKKTIQKEDKIAFKHLFESFYPSLCLFANKYLNDQEVSQDIAQDAFLYFWNKKADFNSKNSVRSYLYRYVRDRSLNYLRNRKLRHQIELKKMESEFSLRDNLIEEETYHIIYSAIRTLSPQAQQVIELSLDGLKNQEIADQLNISINSVKTVKARAFTALRVELKDNIFIFFMLIKCGERKRY
ncbi:MAG: RNA polymerase sigma-70 factor [Mangrovibacterium sp.]